MAEKKTQMKPKQVKPKMQKKPNNKTAKAVKETKTMTEANKAKVQKATTPKPKTTKKPKTDKLIIEKHPEKSKTGVVLSVDKDGNPHIADLNPNVEPQVAYIKPESTTATHDGELGGDPCPCTTTCVPAEPELSVEDRLIKIFDMATMTVLTKDQIRESKKLYKTLGIDSLDRLDVAMAVEKEFNILFSKDDAIALTKHSFKDALKLVESYDSIGK